MSEIIATVILLYKPYSGDRFDWIEIRRKHLTFPTIRVGRAKDCELRIDYAKGAAGAAISRYHATMFKWDEQNDFEIMDGRPGEATIANPNAPILSSQVGTWVNNRKLEVGEKVLLKDRDEVSLLKGSVKFIYLRPHNKVSDSLPLNDDTFIPPELYAADE